MPHPQFDRHAVRMKPLAERVNKKYIERDHVAVGTEPKGLSEAALRTIADAAARIREARKNGRSVMITFGAHTIKNGLAPVLIHLIEQGWVTHLATNGAGIIHDWEYSFQGMSSEDVQEYVAEGMFGNWRETGFYINMAINVGAYEGLGYGEAVGGLIQNEALEIPDPDRLEREIRENIKENPYQAAAAADLLGLVRELKLEPGRMKVPHPWKRFSVQAAARRLGVPFTGHPMIGHDIIYNHPMNHCALLGRAAQRDFLAFAHSVSNLDGGAYISIGSAVMSPMIFEKSLSISQNVALQQGRRIENHYMLIVDLARSIWDWSQGEPPETSPDYYLRYNKSFSRMGGVMRTLSADNRDFLLGLARELNG